MLHLKNVYFRYYQNCDYILKNISFDLKVNDFTAIIGPNGSGKSSLLRVISRINKNYEGDITLDNIDVLSYDVKEYAKKIAYLPQEIFEWYDISVFDIVFMGRFPYLKGFGFATEKDKEICISKMNITKVFDLKDKMISELSGGEKQRVYLCSILAQESKLLILDEPTSHLDLQNELEFFRLLKDLSQQGKGVLISTHNINLASLFCKKIIFLENGKIVFQGSPEEIINDETINKIYGENFKVEINKKTKKPYIFPVRI